MAESPTTTYYDIPLLKRPLWRWEIAWYFFLEGISSGTYLLGVIAELLDRERNQELVQAARYASIAAILPCPPLLIADLGRPERFAHMLRVFKPSSPMNFGAWALTAYSGPVALLAGSQMAADKSRLLPSQVRSVLKHVPERLTGVAGVPAALAMMAYPGVLLSTTSIPVWSRTRVLGALFACSSFSAAAAVLSFVLHYRDADDRLLRKLRKVELLASGAEGVALAGYLLTSGGGAKPLISGRYAKHVFIGAVVGGILLPALIGGKGKRRGLFAAALTIAGSFALKWAVVHAGRDSADDAAGSHEAALPNESATGWKSKYRVSGT